MTAPIDFITLGEGVHRGEAPDKGITLLVDRLRREHGDLIGELTVTCNLPGARRLTDEDIISAGSLNLSSIRARQDRASYLAKRSQLPADQFDWYGALEYFCLRAINAERSGQPSILLRDVPKPDADLTWTIHGLPILRAQPMILFGDGGAGKTTLAESIAGTLAHQGVPTLYCDWETDQAEHRCKLEELFGDTLPAVRYLRCAWPLTHEVDRIRREVLVHGITYVVIDSAGVACSGAPEAAESANEFFRALRQIRVGALILAHVTKSEGGEHKPFGSVFWANNARATWYIKRSEADGDPSQMTVALHNRKVNRGPLLPARGLRLTFGDRITIRPTDLAQHDDFAATLPLWQRIVGTLRSGPKTYATIAADLDAKVPSVERAVQRSRGRVFTRVEGADGITRIALVERRSA
jgi:hypothetical protein